MEDHTIVERQLKADIIRKNLIRKSLQQKLDSVRRWTALLEKDTKKQQKNRFRNSIDRYREQIDGLKKELSKQNEELEARILSEMHYSEDEVKAFQAELKKETKALEKVKAELQETAATGKTKEDPELKLKRRRLEKLLNEESKKIDASEKELVSEARDKVLFTRELKRIALEKELYRP